MAKIQAPHFQQIDHVLYATQSVMLAEIMVRSGVLMGIAGRNKDGAGQWGHELSEALADCGLERRILTAHAAARLCWWSAGLALGIDERSTYRTSCRPLHLCPTCKHEQHVR